MHFLESHIISELIAVSVIFLTANNLQILKSIIVHKLQIM